MNTMPRIRVGLAGNPNCGKTTLFNAITGAHQKVGNYAGVTVDTKEGVVVHNNTEFIIYDLPGVYSLSAYSLDEVVARDFILNEKPDVIIDVLDATNLERNLYLCLQFQELGIPVVGALNIMDQAESMGVSIDDKTLSQTLGIPLVRTIGTKGKGIDELLDNVAAQFTNQKKSSHTISYGLELELEVEKLSAVLRSDSSFASTYPVRWYALKLLEKDTNAEEKLSTHIKESLVKKEAADAINRIEKHFGRDAQIIVSEQRYAYVHGAIRESVQVKQPDSRKITETVDNILLNQYLGLPILVLILWAIFNITFTLGAYPMHWLEHGIAWLSHTAMVLIPGGIAKSLIVNGILAGVGGVLSFVPLIVILFACISFLEDTGYMARAAFITDRFLHIFGLHGQSFFPMMLGFGCSVPAIMAVRTLKSPKDRILTALIIPFMSCGAKLPVYVLLSAAFFPQNPTAMVMLIYGIGIVLGLLSASLLHNNILKGESTPFVMELPPYRMPTMAGMLWHVWDKTWHYLQKAGTVLLAASVIIWAMVSFPKPHDASEAPYALEHSIAGRIGKVIEPVIAPLGFDWKIGIAAITGFAAKEAMVSTLGVLYKTEYAAGDHGTGLRAALRDDPGFSQATAFALMLLTLIAPPCLAAMSAMRAEIGFKWLAVGMGYLLSLAWVLCFAGYQIGRLFLK